MRLSDTYRLSEQAASLWGKSDYGEGERWLPLFLHMCDSARVARGLWELWVPKGTKATIARAFYDDESLAETAFVFLAGVHDIGKATPAFQSQQISTRDEGEALLDWKPREAGLDTSILTTRAGQRSTRPCPPQTPACTELRTRLSLRWAALQGLGLCMLVMSGRLCTTSRTCIRPSSLFPLLSRVLRRARMTLARTSGGR